MLSPANEPQRVRHDEGQGDARRRAFDGRRALVVLAVVASGAGPFLWLFDGPSAAESVFLIGVVLASAAPLLFARWEKRFRIACGVACLALTYVAFEGAYVGLGIFLPGALLLLAAAAVPTSWRPTARRFVIGTVAVIGGLVVLASAVLLYETAIRPPNAFRVYFDQSLEEEELDSLTTHIIDTPGVASLGFIGPPVQSGEPVEVWFDGNVDDRVTAKLRQTLSRLEGVVRIELCRC